MRLKSDTEILDAKTRKQIIEEIKGKENQRRKNECFKRYLCYKDRTSDFVIEHLLRQFDQSTVLEMAYAISNISLLRKVVDKLARVYSSGVQREIVGDEVSTQNMADLEDALDFNTQIKLTNKFLKLQKNVAMYIKPVPCTDEGENKYKIKLEPLNPYLYDVVEDYNNRTEPLVYILSDFKYTNPINMNLTTSQMATHNYTANVAGAIGTGDGKDQKIADAPEDAKMGEIIWWSKNYHFTTDTDGNITSQDIENPIKKIPFVNFALEQDGQFWAEGGNDLVDGNVLINSILTHNQHVAITQGYGQFWMRGKSLPRNIKVGANKAILMEYQEGDPTPEIGYANATPQLVAMGAMIDRYIALLLTTNNLSTSAVASQLTGTQMAASGIAMVIDKAESMEDVMDQRQIFIDKEPIIWDIINKWISVYGDNLDDEFKGKNLPEDFEDSFSIEFRDQPVIMSETEKLNNLKLRRDIGLDSQLDIIMKDNPQLDEQQAVAKLQEITKEKLENMQAAQAVNGVVDGNNQDNGQQKQDGINTQPK